MSYLYKLATQNTKISKVNPDAIVKDTSGFMKAIIDSISEGDMITSAINFYGLAHYARRVYIGKNTYPNTIEDARDFADATEYYTETLKEASTMIHAMLMEKYGSLIPADIMQAVATYASEEKKLSEKKIVKHIESLIPSPRVKTNDKRGRK